MKVLLVQWNENPDLDTGSGHGVHGAMQGMVDEATISRLTSLEGNEFDQLWLTSMIAHHQGAIEMAKAEVANGANVDAKSLADRIIDTQQAEIGQMNADVSGFVATKTAVSFPSLARSGTRCIDPVAGRPFDVHGYVVAPRLAGHHV